MKKIKFCFGIHNHQPVGNFGWVIEDAYLKSYFPFLELLDKFPQFRFSLHFTGILYDWIKQNHPECFDLIRKMRDRGQLELLTGGFYEPILPSIPDRDKVGQIIMESDFIEKEFGVRPAGMWLAERVWEPSLPKHLSKAGITYTILDDIHFRYAGLSESELDGYFITEDQGYKTALFPIAKRLRYTIPFADPEETVAYLRAMSTESGDSIAVYADDGEKFGVWPKTYEHCFVNGWLERFLQAICSNLDWIEMLTFSEALSAVPPRGRVYLPTASYSEMNEWAMPVVAIGEYNDFVHKLKDTGLYEQFEPFVKGGFWRNFQTKYTESNNLHKRMLNVSDLLERSKKKLTPATYAQARKQLYAGQCNCPYWHGVFGGLYLPHLRGALYQEIVSAESCIKDAIPALKKGVLLEQIDFDCDGRDEIIISTPNIKAIIAPHLGGMILELDHFGVAKNLVDIVGRRREGYHDKLLNRRENTGAETKSIHDLVLVKEEGLEQLLVEDTYRRGMFVDHFFAESVTPADFETGKFTAKSGRPDQPYSAVVTKSKSTSTVTLTRRDTVNSWQGPATIELIKSLSFASGNDGMTADYSIKNTGPRALSVVFGCEIALGSYPFPNTEAFLLDSETGRLVLGTSHELKQRRTIAMYSRLYRHLLTCELSHAATIWTHPLWTVSLSEGGFEKVMQGTILLPHWKLNLGSGESWSVKLALTNKLAVAEPDLPS
ncbi:MAG: alpha-amylase/4-alpha-glucanotransferase domain-containing protein [Candidatus Zixiibacteriota bacterium]